MDEKEQLRLLGKMLDEVSEGNFSFTLDESRLDSGYAELYKKLRAVLTTQKRFFFEMQAATGKITSVSEDLGSTLAESKKLSDELCRNAEKLIGLNHQSFSMTLDAVGGTKELIAHLEEIRQLSDKSNSANQTAGESIKNGTEQVYGLIERIGAIDKATAQTVEFVGQFSHSAEKISEILRNVNNLARQTEILSFNASIESKRAGAAGAGFGVIAGAIRDLANESKREVSNISDVVTSISSGLDKLKANIYENQSNVAKSVESTRTIEESFSEITQTYSGLSGMIGSISGKTAAEDALAKQISEKLNAVEKCSGETKDGFATIYDAVGRQSDMMKNLSSLGEFLAQASSGLSETTGKTIKGGYDREAVLKLSQEIFGLLRSSALEKPDFSKLNPEEHRKTLDLLYKHSHVDAVWSNDSAGRFIYSVPAAGIANAKARDWFKNSIAGGEFISETYISAITKEPCVTVSLPIRDPEGTVVGVIGADLKLG